MRIVVPAWLALVFGAVLLLQAAAAFAAAQAVPDGSKTPGAWRSDLTEKQIKTTVWGSDERHVTPAMKAQVAKRYGVTGIHDKSCGTPRCELDHDYPRCLGGADAVDNLWPQAAPWWHLKDLVEDHACQDFRAGRIDLKTARGYFEQDWRVQFRALCRAGTVPAKDCALIK